MIKQIKKRDGSIVSFKPGKITNAVLKAALALGIESAKAKGIAQKISKKVVSNLEKRFVEKVPHVEDVQDEIIAVLNAFGYKTIAFEYSEYRKKKAEARELAKKLAVEPKIGVNALEVLKARYLLKDEEGNIIETPMQMFRRVARAIAAVDSTYGEDARKTEEEFYRVMSRLEFLPNSPTLFNAGAPLKQLSACFVLPVEDSLESIFTTVKNMALIEQTGGGVGFDFSKLRPKGDIVRSTKGVASGPVSFMRVFNITTEIIKAGGKRRGAMMGVLRVDHPDIIEFITAKSKEGELSNFNLSVAVTDSFMNAVAKNKKYPLINPRTGKTVKEYNAREIWNLIIENAWKRGDPGIIFIDEINRHNPTPALGKITGTNPCVSGNTWVLTTEGAIQVEECKGKEINLVLENKAYYSKGFFKTGDKEVFRLVTKEGFEVEATGDHKFLQAEKITRYSIHKNWKELNLLKKGDKVLLNDCTKIQPWKGEHSEEEGYLMGLLVGDGHISKGRAVLSCWIKDKGYEGIKSKVEKMSLILAKRSDFKGWKKIEKDNKYQLRSTNLNKLAKKLNVGEKLHKTVTPKIEKESYDFYKGFLRGLFDTDGSVQGSQFKGISIRLTQSNLNTLKAVQRMLLRLGIFSRIYQCRRDFSKRLLPNGKGGKKRYLTKPQHELVISNSNVKRFHTLIGFYHTEKARRLEELLKKYKRQLNKERFIVEVKEIEPLGIKPVFDANVGDIHSFDANGFIVHNCGEVPLLPYESCNLGSIDISKMVDKGKINFDKLEKTIKIAVHFLDNVIDANKYHLKEIEEMTKANRKIGLGIMGWAECLIKLKIPYDSESALKLAEKVMSFVTETARKASVEIAKKRGSFPNLRQSIYAKKYPALRNATLTTIAPTGSISIIAGCSSGIEPLFAVSFMRHVLEGTRLFEVNPLFEQIAKERDFYSAELLERIARTGSVQNIKIPADVKRIFKTALDIKPEWHVRMQAAFQKHVDNAVSKTVNLPANAKISDVRKVYELAHKLKCKGITVYRYGSKPEQVLYFGAMRKEKHISAAAEYAGGCPTGVCPH